MTEQPLPSEDPYYHQPHSPSSLTGMELEDAHHPTILSVTGPQLHALALADELIGIWVTPTFRKNLLHWINQWPAEEVERLFKDRSPESLLIASAADLPAQYQAYQERTN